MSLIDVYVTTRRGVEAESEELYRTLRTVFSARINEDIMLTIPQQFRYAEKTYNPAVVVGIDEDDASLVWLKFEHNGIQRSVPCEDVVDAIQQELL